MRLISAQELRNPPNANTRSKAPLGVIRCVLTLALQSVPKQNNNNKKKKNEGKSFCGTPA